MMNHHSNDPGPCDSEQKRPNASSTTSSYRCSSRMRPRGSTTGTLQQQQHRHGHRHRQEQSADADEPLPSFTDNELMMQHNTELIRRHSQMILDLVRGSSDSTDSSSSSSSLEQEEVGEDAENKHNQLKQRRHDARDFNSQQQHRSHTNTTTELNSTELIANRNYRNINDDDDDDQVEGTKKEEAEEMTPQPPPPPPLSEELQRQHTELIRKHSQMILDLIGADQDDNDDDHAPSPSLAFAAAAAATEEEQVQQKHQYMGMMKQGNNSHHFGGIRWTAATTDNIIAFRSSSQLLSSSSLQRVARLEQEEDEHDDDDESKQNLPTSWAACVRARKRQYAQKGQGGAPPQFQNEHDGRGRGRVGTTAGGMDDEKHHHHHHQGDIENGIIKIASSFEDNPSKNDADFSSNDDVMVAACCISSTILPFLMQAHHTVVLADVPQLVDPHEEQEREKKVLGEMMRKIPHATPVELLEQSAAAGSGGGVDDKNDDYLGVLSTLLPHCIVVLFCLAVVVVSGIAAFARYHGGDAVTEPPRNDKQSQASRGNSGSSSYGTVISLSPTAAAAAAPIMSKAPHVVSTPARPPTVESVMQYGKLRCGVHDFKLAYHLDTETCGVQDDDPATCGKKSMEIDLCNAVAASIFGNTQQYELVEMQIDERFIALHNQTVDLYLRAAPTMERDIHEKSTGAGFSFSVPYGYGTVRFGGHSRFVDCADQRNTFGECADLQVCVIKGSLHTEMLGLPQSYLVERELDGMLSGLLHGTCNVAIGHTADLEKALPLVPNNIDVKLGSRVLASEPVAIATRDDDPMWSDLVNWVLLALVHADELGINQNKSYHFPTTMSFGRGFEHMFQHAIGSVGTFLEIRNRYSIGRKHRKPRDALHLVSGERELSGALLSPDLGNAHTTVGPDPVANGYMNRVFQRGHIICGIARQRAGFAQQDPQTGVWSGMDVDFCRAVSASLFHENPDRHLKIVDFDENNIDDTLQEVAFEALANGRVDILSGMSMSLSRDVSEPSSGKGCSFSLPYYYDNEQLGLTRALVTQQDDSQWSSFVYWIVACTIYAEERQIAQRSSSNSSSNDCDGDSMPVVKLYGNNYTRMLRDAIQHVGNYGEIYRRNLQAYIPRHGLNMLSSDKIGQQLRTIAF